MKLVYDPEKLLQMKKKLGKPIKPVDHSPHLDKMRLLLDKQVLERKIDDTQSLAGILAQQIDEQIVKTFNEENA